MLVMGEMRVTMNQTAIFALSVWSGSAWERTVLKLAQPLFIAGLVTLVAACAPTHTVQQAPPPPPPPLATAPPPPPMVAPAPPPEMAYAEPAPRRYVRRHHRKWCRCAPVRHHRRHRGMSSMEVEPEPVNQAGSAMQEPAPAPAPMPSVAAPMGRPAPAVGGPRPSGH